MAGSGDAAIKERRAMAGKAKHWGSPCRQSVFVHPQVAPPLTSGAARCAWTALARRACKYGAAMFLIAEPIGRFVFRRSEEHTSELQSLMRITYPVFCLKKKNNTILTT